MTCDFALVTIAQIERANAVNEIIQKQFNNIAEDGKVLSPLPQAYPSTPLSDEISQYISQKIAEIEGADSFDRRWDFDKIADKDNDSFQTIYLASATKGKTSRLLIDYKNMLNLDGLGNNNEKQWENATLLQTTVKIRENLTRCLNNAFDELEDSQHISDETSQALVQLSVNASYVNEAMTRSMLDFMERNPDEEYENGNKQKHFLFDSSLSKGGQYHLADIRHGNTQDQCMLVAEGAKLANQHRMMSLDNLSDKTNLLSNQNSNFEDTLRKSVFGEIDFPEP